MAALAARVDRFDVIVDACRMDHCEFGAKDQTEEQMPPLGGPCRVELPGGEWPDVNGGLTYTDRVQGSCAATLLQFYATKHASSAPVEHWRQAILGGRISINGQMVSDPQTPVP